ncbi:hypothetical protein DM2_2407 [Halorubrum sp. DM2]|uniref:YncE family protein n=1 Tax=Halorubrum sp. DM2 TaxID=2527867 RepID=UPI0024B84676|nr:hypothetical protein [Halorubrum sp. DM2]VTT86369.1 hypothetical protein DM2_2407 [Halorubrum sp. DM2]
MSGDGRDGEGGDETGRVVAVPCEGDDLLALFDLSTGEGLGEVPVGSHPVHAATHRGRTFVATMGERAVTAVDPEGTVTHVGTGVLGPSHFATAGDELVVSCSAGDALAVIDPDGPRLAGRIAVGAEPHELAVSPGGERLYSGSRRDGVVDVVDVAARERVGAVDAGEDARVQGVALAPDGDRGYAVDQRGASVVAFDSATAEGLTADGNLPVDATAAVGADPYDLVVTGNRVFVPGRAAGTVHEFDADLRLDAVHEGFDRPVDLFRVRDRWWVLDAGAAELRSLSGATVATPAPGLAAASINDRLVVSHYDDNVVSLVDVDDGVVWTAETPEYPFGSVVV